MGFASRLTLNNRIFEYFMVSSVIVLAVAMSFFLLSRILAEVRDTQRISDISALRSALELYYIEHGRYPDTGWVNSAAPSWNIFGQVLDPYITAIPHDPINDPGGPVERAGTLNYSYYNKKPKGGKDDYIIVFRLERPEDAALYQGLDTGLITAQGRVNFLNLMNADGVYIIRAP